MLGNIKRVVTEKYDDLVRSIHVAIVLAVMAIIVALASM